jgi:aminocarboxymuconate-semialdehyde decarboxylase
MSSDPEKMATAPPACHGGCTSHGDAVTTSDASKPRRIRIDCHTHILPSNLPPDYYTSYKQGTGEKYVSFEPCAGSCNVRMFHNGKFFREVEENCFAPSARLRDMADTDVDVQVLSTVPVMFSYWEDPDDAIDLAMRINDEISEVCRANPSRFIGLGTLPMTHPELAIQELRRLMSLGLAGVEIGSNVGGRQLSEPEFFPIFEACAELGAAVFIHPWNMPRPDTTSKYWLPWLVGMPAETSMAICSLIFSRVFDRLPSLRVMFAHGGGSFPGTIGRIEHGYGCRPDLVACDGAATPRDYLRSFWIDSLVHDEDALQLVYKLFGSANIVMGSDYPFPLGEQAPGALVDASAALSDADKDALLWRNAFAWLGMSDKPFRAAAEERVAAQRRAAADRAADAAGDGATAPATE